MKILVAPSGFKESLGARSVAKAIKKGIKKVYPNAKIVLLPLVDGGEGFTKELIRIRGGEIHKVKVTGPVGKKTKAHYGLIEDSHGKKTAVIEMAAAAGLRLVPITKRDPLATTSYGVGELIKAALDHNVHNILIGCGDSGINDGGAGMAQALGVRLLNKNGQNIGYGCKALNNLTTIDMNNIDPRMKDVEIEVACNWTNVLCGPKGVSKVFGPQKGASPEMVSYMSDALENYAKVIEEYFQKNMRLLPGSGASGGLGTGLHVFLNAKLSPRFEVVTKYIDLEGMLENVDLVLTAEGAIDFQTPNGKIPSEVANRAKQRDIPIIAIAGTLGIGAKENLKCGIDSIFSIIDKPMNLQRAFEEAKTMLTDCTENVMRTLMIGKKLSKIELK